MKKTLLTLFFIFANIFPAHAEKIPYIVTTTAQIGDVARNIAGNHAQIDYIMGSGIDPHLYQPTRSDMFKFVRADIIFYNGIKLEGRMEDIFENMQKLKPTISIADNLPKGALHTMDSEVFDFDPHIWMDTQNWIHATQIITDTLCKEIPAHCEDFKVNSIAYKQQLEELDKDIAAQFKKIPKRQRVLVTAHDAFGYLASAYNIEVIGIQGISTQSEAGIKRITDLVTLLCERKIPAVFVETSVSQQNIKAIIEGAKARGHNVTIGGSLYSDAMGAEGTAEATYIGMMRHNANVISNALSRVM